MPDISKFGVKVPEEIPTPTLKSILNAQGHARMKMWLEICTRCGLCADSCFFYLAHDRKPEMAPAYKVQALRQLYRTGGEATKELLEEMFIRSFAECTACRRCSMYCPFGIDIATMVSVQRAILTAMEMTPEGLARSCENYLQFGNQMAVTQEDWVETCAWMEEETAAELPGLKIPMDKKGARIMYTVNAREPKFYPQDIALAARVFHLVGEDWTMPSTGWDDTNLAMFAAHPKAAARVTKLIYDKAVELGVEAIAITECGHAYRSVAFEGPYFLGLPGGKPPVPVVHSVQLFYEYVRDGRLKLDKTKITEPVTYQDPCNVSRNGGLCEEPRFIMDQLVTNFVDMQPNREHNYCCGGGGGFIPMGPPFKPLRMKSGKIKAEQIRKTGAKIACVPCHNCYDQINDLNKHYELGIKVESFKELFEKAAIVPEHMKPKE
jgi:Fe-S oxidoreductase